MTEPATCGVPVVNWAAAKLSVTAPLAAVMAAPVTATVMVPKAAAVEVAAVFVTSTLPIVTEVHAVAQVMAAPVTAAAEDLAAK